MRHRTLLPALILLTALLSIECSAGEEDIAIYKSEPTLDRWMYPFNATPGTRIAASVFGNADQYEGSFDNRDAQMIIGFETATELPPGTIEDLQVISAEVTLQVSNEGIVYDPTTDPYTAFLDPKDENYVEDEDPGQPIELYGLGYRSGFNAGTWAEDSAFSFDDPLLPGVRTAFAIENNDGEIVDISNHVREGWTPTPFATATVDDVAPGETIPIDSIFTFSFDVAAPDVQEYILAALDEGQVNFAISSMTSVEVMAGTFPLFYCKENPLVDFGAAAAATLEIVVAPLPTNPCDLTGDGVVDGADLTVLLGSWGTDDALADLDASGTVDGADLTILLGCWG